MGVYHKKCGSLLDGSHELESVQYYILALKPDGISQYTSVQNAPVYKCTCILHPPSQPSPKGGRSMFYRSLSQELYALIMLF